MNKFNFKYINNIGIYLKSEDHGMTSKILQNLPRKQTEYETN